MLLAKSEVLDYKPVALSRHLREVGDAAAVLAGHFGLDPVHARLGGYLHDIGKAHPFFQYVQLKGERAMRIGLSVTKFGEKPVFRHEIASMAFLPLFEQELWPMLTEMVAAHHKSVVRDKRQRGLLDLAEQSRKWKDIYLHQWEEWSAGALAVFEELGVQTRPIAREEAEETLDWVFDYCEQLPKGWSRQRGLLMAADHFVSSRTSTGSGDLPRFEKPHYQAPFEPDSLFPLSQRTTDDPALHTLLLAPTGAGKTDFLLQRCRGRIFYLLPFQASINAMYDRFRHANYPGQDVRLLHAGSRFVAKQKGADKEQIDLQAHVGASVKVLTPFQLANMFFCGHGFEAQMLDVAGCDVILDEIHTYSDVSQAFVLALVELLVHSGCRVHIGTATMPTALYGQLRTILQKNDTLFEVSLTDAELDTYNRHTVHKLPADTEIEPLIEEQLAQDRKVLVVMNTVKEAQQAFRAFSQAHPGVRSMLIHSRFRRKDRNELESRLLNEFDKGSGACVVFSTQVVEVSLDISFDVMITQAAPLDALIQRFGRVNRRRTRERLGKQQPVYVIAPAESVLPYKKDVVEKSFEVLPDNAVLKAGKLQQMLDAVYPEINFQTISSHIWWNGAHCKLKQLQHISKPVMQEVLDFSGAVCILESEKDTYLEANWEDRVPFEIPVSESTMRRYATDYPQLEDLRNRPFVIPDALYSTTMGLQLQAPDTIL